MRFFYQKINKKLLGLCSYRLFCALLYAVIAIIFVVSSSQHQAVVAAKTQASTVAQAPTTEILKTPDSIMRCRVTYYLTSLTDFNFVEGTFYVNVWLGANCNNPDTPSTESLYFPTAKDYIIPIKDTIKNIGEGSYWFANVQGNFRKDWDLSNFPFDRHKLQIPFRLTYPDATQFLFEPNRKYSGIDKSLRLQDGWRIINYSVDTGISQFSTNFADPRATVGKIAQSNMNMTIEIERTSYFGFIKLVGGVYIAFAVCALCFLSDAADSGLYSANLGVMVGTLFAVFVNLQAAGSVLGQAETLSMTDQIHIVTMFYILLAMLMETIFFVGHQKQWRIDMTRVEHLSELGFVTSYILINVAMIFLAYRAG